MDVRRRTRARLEFEQQQFVEIIRKFYENAGAFLLSSTVLEIFNQKDWAEVLTNAGKKVVTESELTTEG